MAILNPYKPDYCQSKQDAFSALRVSKDKIHLVFIIVLASIYLFAKYNSLSGVSNIVFLIFVGITAFSNINQLMYMLLFFSPMYLYVTIQGFPLYNVIIFSLLIKLVFSRHTRMTLTPLLIIIMILIIEMINMMKFANSPSLNMLKLFLIMFITIMHLYNTPTGYSVQKGITYFIYGSLIYAIGTILINVNTAIDYSNRSGGLGELDPNTYGLYALFTVSVIIHHLLTRYMKKKHIILYVLFIAVIYISGFMTLSKTFIILSVFMLLSFLLLSVRNIKKSLTLCFLITVGTSVLINIPYIADLSDSLIYRFGMAENIDELTTGRSESVKMYISYLDENIKALFFGEGLYSYFNLFDIRPHNSTLELIISWGIIGTILFCTMYFRAAHVYWIKNNNFKKIKLINIVPIMILLVFMQSLTLFYQEATYLYILLAIQVLFHPTNEKNE